MPARAYVVGKKVEMPETIKAKVFRTVNSCWLCDNERQMRWEVHLPYGELQLCPPIWEDDWVIHRQRKGHPVASGVALRKLFEDKQRWEEERSAYVARRTQEILDDRQQSRKRAEKERKENLMFDNCHSRWLEASKTLDLVAKLQLIKKSATKRSNPVVWMTTLAAWVDRDLRAQVEEAIRMLGPSRVLEELRGVAGWPTELIEFVDGIVYRQSRGPGAETFFAGYTEPHRNR